MAYQGKFSRKSSANHLYHECKGNMYVIRNSTGFSRGNIEFYPLKYFKIKFDSKRRPRSPRLPRWWYPRHSLGLAFWSCLSAGVIYLRCDTATLDTQFGPFGQACMYMSLSPQPGSVPAPPTVRRDWPRFRHRTRSIVPGLHIAGLAQDVTRVPAWLCSLGTFLPSSARAFSPLTRWVVIPVHKHEATCSATPQPLGDVSGLGPENCRSSRANTRAGNCHVTWQARL